MKNILDFSDFSSINEDLSEYTPKLISLINTKKNSRIGLVTGHQNMENTHLLLMMMVIPS